MAKITFNKFEQLDEGALSYVGNVVSSELLKALFPDKLASDIHNSLTKKLKFIMSGSAKTEQDIKDLEKYLAYMENSKQQLIREFIINYIKMIGNIYVPQDSPTALDKIRYLKTKPSGYIRFIPDNDVRILEKFIVSYIGDFERAVRASYTKHYEYSDSLLRSKLEAKIKDLPGFSKPVNAFVDSGGIVGAVRGKKISIYSQITDFMRKVVDIMREIEEVKQELEKLKKKLDDQKRTIK